MREKYELDLHSKNGSFQNVEKRLAEFQENEKKLQGEVERLRLEKDQKTLEYQKSIEQEKDGMKNRVKDVEEKLRKM